MTRSLCGIKDRRHLVRVTLNEAVRRRIHGRLPKILQAADAEESSLRLPLGPVVYASPRRNSKLSART